MTGHWQRVARARQQQGRAVGYAKGQSAARAARGRLAATREELAALFNIDLLAAPGPPCPSTVLEPVRGKPGSFDVSCSVCGVISRYDKAPTFAILIAHLQRAGWRIGAGTGWPRAYDALRDLQADRTCPECAAG